MGERCIEMCDVQGTGYKVQGTKYRVRVQCSADDRSNPVPCTLHPEHWVKTIHVTDCIRHPNIFTFPDT
jgi:hypothetical protein